MEKPIMDLSQVDLQAEVTSYKVGLNMVWPTFFPLRYTPKMDFKSLSGNEGLPISADRIAFNVKAPVKTRKKIRWTLFSGNRKKMVNLIGNLHGAKEDRDGILNAPL